MKRYLVLFLWFACFLTGILGFVYTPFTAGKIVTPVTQKVDGYYTTFEFDYKCYNCGGIHHYSERFHKYELNDKVPSKFKENKYYGQTIWSGLLFVALIISGFVLFPMTICSSKCFDEEYEKGATVELMNEYYKCRSDCEIRHVCKLANAKSDKLNKFLGNETLS